jgi:peptidyl-prolyl cis-trans isomerase B (cyclophilin B)
MMKWSKLTLMLMLIAVIAAVTAGCGGGNASNADSASGQKNPIVTMEMEDGGVVKLELYPAIAPNTVANFISLTNQGFYDGLIFHRVIPGFMIQGGDPEGTGMGGPDYAIQGEFANNGINNALKHTRGVISMARSMSKDSAGSQFFIMVADATHLDGDYAAFGRVTEGLETVDKIVGVETGAQDRPTVNQTIMKMTVDTFGIEYGEPKKMNE